MLRSLSLQRFSLAVQAFLFSLGVSRGDISLFSRFNAGKSWRPQVQEALLQKAVATQRQRRLPPQRNGKDSPVSLTFCLVVFGKSGSEELGWRPDMEQLTRLRSDTVAQSTCPTSAKADRSVMWLQSI